ncbi:MAG: response regulator transcription factor [Acidobacteria bacterium]|nr:response regulator transcription factor [Acidobacteriota bacterium]
MKALRILVADEQEVIRRGVRALLQACAASEVCGEAATGREAVAKAKQLKPHIVLLEVNLPQLNGLEATRHILKALPKTEVLVYTTHKTEQIVREALAAGARGYVLKTDPGATLAAAVEALRQHKPFFASAISEALLENYVRSEPAAGHKPATHSRLSSREREVIQLLAEGRCNKEVAAALGISVKTAETHRANILRKLRLHSITDLVRYAIRNKIIEA